MIKRIFFSAVAASMMCSLSTGMGRAADCGAGQSEAVLVTSKGSITMCVDDDLVESPYKGASLEVQAAECPCAPYVPGPRDWGSVKDVRQCSNTSNGLLIEAIGERLTRKSRREEVWTFASGAVGNYCSFQIQIDGFIYQSNRYMIANETAAQACRTFAAELFADISGKGKDSATCPAP